MKVVGVILVFLVVGALIQNAFGCESEPVKTYGMIWNDLRPSEREQICSLWAISPTEVDRVLTERYGAAAAAGLTRQIEKSC